MPGNLDTTNVLLGIIAAVSVIEGLVLIAVGVFAYRLYAQAMRTVQELEARHVAPLVARVDTLMRKVDGILVDVKRVTARVGERTERVDTAMARMFVTMPAQAAGSRRGARSEWPAA